MNKPIAVLIVGHADWGKSRTLRELTNGNFRQRRITIKGTEFFIRRMSNDDDPEGFIIFVENLDATAKPQLLATFCPKFTATGRAKYILQTLQNKKYKLYFFIIEHQYGTDEVVTRDEIANLRQFGTVKIYSQRSESAERARALRTFISNDVVA